MDVKSGLTLLARLTTRRPEISYRLREALSGRFDRVVDDAVAVAQETGGPIGKAVGDVLMKTPMPQTACRLQRIIPRSSVSLMEAGLEATRQCLAALDDRPDVTRAALLTNLSVRLSNTGRWDEAMVAINDALAACPEDRDLELANAERAHALHTKANLLSTLTRYAEALDCSEEALSLRRSLARQNSERYRPFLANTLHTLAGTLMELGEHSQAEEPLEEAVAIFLELYEQNPTRYRYELGGALHLLAEVQTQLDRSGEALANAEHATDLFRTMADTATDAFVLELAGALNNLSQLYSRLGEPSQALQVAAEAVSRVRPLESFYGEPARPRLATFQHTFANACLEMGVTDEAWTAVREAEAEFRRLSITYPETYEPKLASALTTKSSVLAALGQSAKALAAAEEACDLHRRRAAQYPKIQRAQLARALTGLANRFGTVERWDMALAAASEAVDIFAELVDAGDKSLIKELASARNVYAYWLTGAGPEKLVLALEQSRTAEQAFRALAAEHRASVLPELARNLRDQATILALLGEDSSAQSVASESLHLYEKLARANPERHALDLEQTRNMIDELGRLSAQEIGNGLDTPTDREINELLESLRRPNVGGVNVTYLGEVSNLVHSLADAGRFATALELAQALVMRARSEAARVSEIYEPVLAVCLHTLATVTITAGLEDKAISPASEAVTRFRELAASDPDATNLHLAVARNTLAFLRHRQGDVEGALELMTEVVDALRARVEGLFPADQDRLVQSLETYAALLAEIGRTEDAKAAISLLQKFAAHC